MGGKSHPGNSIPDHAFRSSAAIPTELLGPQISPLFSFKLPVIGWSDFGRNCSTRRDLIWRDVKYINPLKRNDHYSSRTALLNSKRCILYIYSKNICKNILNMVYTLRFFSSERSLFHNSNVFDSCIIRILYVGCAKIKKLIPAPKD